MQVHLDYKKIDDEETTVGIIFVRSGIAVDEVMKEKVPYNDLNDYGITLNMVLDSLSEIARYENGTFRIQLLNANVVKWLRYEVMRDNYRDVLTRIYETLNALRENGYVITFHKISKKDNKSRLTCVRYNRKLVNDRDISKNSVTRLEQLEEKEITEDGKYLDELEELGIFDIEIDELS